MNIEIYESGKKEPVKEYFKISCKVDYGLKEIKIFFGDHFDTVHFSTISVSNSTISVVK